MRHSILMVPWAAACAAVIGVTACDESQPERLSERGALDGQVSQTAGTGDLKKDNDPPLATATPESQPVAKKPSTDAPKPQTGGRPAVLLSSPQKSPTNIAPIRISVLFSDAVVGFDAGDLYVKNGRVTQLDSDPTNVLRYDIAVMPSEDGDVDVSLLENSVQSVGGRGNLASLELTFAYDGSQPKAVFASTAATIGNTTVVSPIPITLTLSEPVPALTKDQFKLSDGVITSFTIDSSTKYSLEVTPTVTGPVSISIDAGITADAAGNKNQASNVYTVTYAGPPTVALTTTAKSPTNLSPIPVTVTFSEAVAGFVLADIVVTGGTGANLATTDNKKFSVLVTPSAQGTVSIAVAADAARSVAGNVASKAATPLTLAFDSVAPTVALSSTTIGTTYKNPIAVKVTFSEPVTGFVKADVTVTNGTIKTFTDAGNGTFDLTITPTTDGVVTASVAAGVAADSAGNPNQVAPDVYTVSYTKVSYATQILPAVAVKCAPCHAAAGGQAGKYAENDKAVWDNAIANIKVRVGNNTMPPPGSPALDPGDKDFILNYFP